MEYEVTVTVPAVHYTLFCLSMAESELGKARGCLEQQDPQEWTDDERRMLSEAVYDARDAFQDVRVRFGIEAGS